MPQYSTTLMGWKAVPAAVVLMAVVAVRLLTFGDAKNDENLLRTLEIQLISDYFPGDVDRLKSVCESGDAEQIERVAQAVTSTKVTVDAVYTSSPLLKFASSKNVVVKVRYRLHDDAGLREARTRHYRFRHHSLGNSWSYRYETGAMSYYLNFF